ncbi:hypothetical protein V6N13_145821 [Hibiscus sabdariffa]|uniref:Mon2/Sec7/BIG1-like HUS domain-containing protein n=1 Tax=Hibiscus sabdariffa TaxID=183260 RepID=A0ABR2TRC0_9ROSI
MTLQHRSPSILSFTLEAFFSCVLLKLAQSKHGSSYQQQEVTLEALLDLCRQQTFVAEMYANYDCDITCSNVFEDIAKPVVQECISCEWTFVRNAYLVGL